MGTSYENSSMEKLAMDMMGAQGFDKTEDVWQLKWLFVIHLALKQQLV